VITDPIVEGFHYYSLVLDGYPFVTREPGVLRYGSHGEWHRNSERSGGDYYTIKDVPHGKIQQVRYYSSVTQACAGRSSTRSWV